MDLCTGRDSNQLQPPCVQRAVAGVLTAAAALKAQQLWVDDSSAAGSCEGEDWRIPVVAAVGHLPPAPTAAASHAGSAPVTTQQQPAAAAAAAAADDSGTALAGSGPQQAAVPTLTLDYEIIRLVKFLRPLSVLEPVLSRLGLATVIFVAGPSAGASAGLSGYGEVLPAGTLSKGALVVVADSAGRAPADGAEPYIWAEIPFTSEFRLDVRGFSSFDDYSKGVLSRKGRWNARVRQERFVESGFILEHPVLDGTCSALVDELWPLFMSTSERNGYIYTTEEDFKRMHLTAPDLHLSLVRDGASGRIVAFCTGARVGDQLSPFWLGIDYSHPQARHGAVYYNMFYELVRCAVEDPRVACVNAGPGHRTAKTSIGFRPNATSLYVRCRSRLERALYTTVASLLYKPTATMHDP